MGTFKRIFDLLRRFTDRWWYLPVCGLLAALDLFILVIPTEGFLVSSILLQPKRWARTLIWFTFGSAIGAAVLAHVSHLYGPEFVHWVLGDAFQTPLWQKLERFLGHYGGIALTVISLGPLPQQPAVAFCGLAQMPTFTVFLAVLIGRGLKYGIFLILALRAPHLLSKVSGVRKETEELGISVSAAGSLGPGVPEQKHQNPTQR